MRRKVAFVIGLTLLLAVPGVAEAGTNEVPATASATVSPPAGCDQLASAEYTVVAGTADVSVLVKRLDPSGGIAGEVVIVPSSVVVANSTFTGDLVDLEEGTYRITLNGRRFPPNYDFEVPGSEPCPSSTTTTTSAPSGGATTTSVPAAVLDADDGSAPSPAAAATPAQPSYTG